MVSRKCETIRVSSVRVGSVRVSSSQFESSILQVEQNGKAT